MSFMGDPAALHRGCRTRSASFENPTAAPGAGGQAGGGRKGAPARVLAPGDEVVLARFEGPGRIGHLWATVAPLTPETLRSLVLEVRYGDGAPSVSVPFGDFFGAVHGVPAPYASALTTVNEGRGFSSRVPLPFRDAIELRVRNAGTDDLALFYQVDALLGPQPEDAGLLHAAFRRENPTRPTEDFVIWDSAGGSGRFLGWTGGVRVADPTRWWGEGEVKLHFDGESKPTVCGTGVEDHLDSAWGLGRFWAPESGAPLVVPRPGAGQPDAEHEWVGFYRWHLSDPVVFRDGLRVTVQQIGLDPSTGGLFERADDWCATAFCYLAEPRAVAPLDVALALADLEAAPAPGARTFTEPGTGAPA